MIRCELHLLQAGSCVQLSAMARAGASFRPATFPALVGLIIHPSEGAVLFDTGYDEAFFAETQRFPERFYRWMTPVTLPAGAAAQDQLRRFGLKPDDIRAVVISHFHGDHVAGLHAFPTARLFCARAGLAEMSRSPRLKRISGGLLAGLVPSDAPARATFFEDFPAVALDPGMAPFDSGADLFGDGSMTAVELPGHCPGHWGLIIRRQDDRPTFLIGDAALSSGGVRDNAPPPRLTTALLGETAVYRRTLSCLHRLWTRNKDILILPSHCQEAAAQAAPLDDH